MKLLEFAPAPNPRRVRFFAAEKGIEIPGQHVDLANLEHFGDAFRSINPFSTVPTLVLDDGTAIAETMAICRYLEALQPEPALFGTTPVEQGLIEMWARRVELGVFSQIAQSFRHQHPGMAKREVPQVAQWGAANTQKAKASLETLNAHLAMSDYVAGSAFSVADITLWIACDFAARAKIEIPESLTALSAWRLKIDARPAVAAMNAGH
ncbi:MAG: glutathione S-transferase [Pseudomonadota bacterium]